MKQYELLIIDDDPYIFDAINLVLESSHIYLDAHSGKEAEIILVDRKIDLIFLDYKLPDTTGLDLLGKIKQKYAHIPVIMITAFPSWELSNEVLSLDYGADYFLSKPWNDNDLREKVEKCLTIGGKKIASRILNSSQKNSSKLANQSKRFSRFQRLFEIRNLIITSPNVWTFGKLATRFELSARQIERDIEELRKCGVRIRNDGSGFYIEEKNDNFS